MPLAIQKVAEATPAGTWQKNKVEPVWNAEGDKALVELTFQSGRDLRIYSATFHQREGKWSLRGIRETEQALLPKEDSQ